MTNHQHNDQGMVYHVNPLVSNPELNALFAAAWPDFRPRDFGPVLRQSLAFVCAYAGQQLVGFVNLAWDGGVHAFILDTTVHPAWQRQGIGRRLVEQATAVAREHGVEWVHVDFEAHLLNFYRQCGFEPTEAGLLDLKSAL